MSEWKTIKETTIEAGGNNFIEINLKNPPDSDNTLIGVAKGNFTEEGEKRYKTNVMFSKDKKDEIVKAIQEIDQ